MTPVDQVSLDPIRVLFVVAEGGPAGAKGAFEALESRLRSLKGRKFYGTMLCPEYRACVEFRDGDDPGTLGLEAGTIPGGLYARTRMREWKERVHEIGPTFDEMARQVSRDPDRPAVEFYRSEAELVLLLPIVETIARGHAGA